MEIMPRETINIKMTLIVIRGYLGWGLWGPSPPWISEIHDFQVFCAQTGA